MAEEWAKVNVRECYTMCWLFGHIVMAFAATEEGQPEFGVVFRCRREKMQVEFGCVEFDADHPISRALSSKPSLITTKDCL